MSRIFHHLWPDESAQIVVSQQQDLSVNAIAEQLGHDKSTIYREPQENIGGSGYRHRQVQTHSAPCC